MIAYNRLVFFFSLIFTFVFFDSLAQKNENDFVERFQKKYTPENYKLWNTYSDSKTGGGSQSYITIQKDSSHKNQALRFSYSLLKKDWDYPPYAGLSCAIDYQALPGPTEAIIYQYKGPAHTFSYLTHSVSDNYFFRKKIAASKEWTTIVIPFSELKQEGGVKVSFNCFDLSGITWVISGNDYDSGYFHLDNIRFIASKTSSYSEKKYNQATDSISQKIFTPYHDSLLGHLSEYKTIAFQYYKYLKRTKQYEFTIDSLCDYLQTSSFSTKDKKLLTTLLALAKNSIPGDINLKIAEENYRWKKKFSSLISFDTLCKIDKNNWVTNFNLNKFSFVAKDWYQYSFFDEKFYQAKDSAREKEIRLFHFKAGDTIAEIGAGNGNFERSFSKYSDNLTIYVNDIDSIVTNKLSVKLTLLQEYDHKNIQYHVIQGNEKMSNLPIGQLDKIIIRNTFHHFTYPNEMTKDLKKALTKDGKLFIIDVMKDEVKKPDCPLFMKREEFLNYFISNGFLLINEVPLDYAHFKLFEFQLNPLND